MKNIKKAKSQNKIRIKDTYWISEMLGWEKWRVKKKKQESLHQVQNYFIIIGET